jgi:hypothetical protein
MAKKAKSGKKEVKVKELPKAAKKMAAKDMKKVRGGDYNGDGVVDSADYLIARKTNVIQKVR